MPFVILNIELPSGRLEVEHTECGTKFWQGRDPFSGHVFAQMLLDHEAECAGGS